jgi:hypothetical protein
LAAYQSLSATLEGQPVTLSVGSCSAAQAAGHLNQLRRQAGRAIVGMPKEQESSLGWCLSQARDTRASQRVIDFTARSSAAPSPSTPTSPGITTKRSLPHEQLGYEEIRGRTAQMLRPVMIDGACCDFRHAETPKAPRHFCHRGFCIGLVAGAGFEPAAFRL